jgi:hypothetical protein
MLMVDITRQAAKRQSVIPGRLEGEPGISKFRPLVLRTAPAASD